MLEKYGKPELRFLAQLSLFHTILLQETASESQAAFQQRQVKLLAASRKKQHSETGDATLSLSWGMTQNINILFALLVIYCKLLCIFVRKRG